TVADLPNQGEPNGFSLAKLAESIGPSLIDTGFNYAEKVTGMPGDLPIILPSGVTTTLDEARAQYQTLWSRWVAREGGGAGGELTAGKAGFADAESLYMGWFAQRDALKRGSELVVMGHTHVPIRGLARAATDYVNIGFDCPSRADFGTKH